MPIKVFCDSGIWQALLENGLTVQFLAYILRSVLDRQLPGFINQDAFRLRGSSLFPNEDTTDKESLMSHSVLIAVADRHEARRAAERFRENGLDVQLAYDGLTALTAFLFSHPDMICIDAALLGNEGDAIFDILALDVLRLTTPVVVIQDPADPLAPRCDRRTKIVNWDRELADCLETVVAEYFGLTLLSFETARV